MNLCKALCSLARPLDCQFNGDVLESGDRGPLGESVYGEQLNGAEKNQRPGSSVTSAP
jgi:hypothetical protein